MTWANEFIAKTLKGFLIVSGLVTSLLLLSALDLQLAERVLFFGLLDHTPASEPALRHWGLMVFGIGILMVVAAFRPWLRFEAMTFSAVEKAFMVSLFLANIGQPWGRAYLILFLVDLTIVLYSLVYFASRHGRPHRWIQQEEL